MTVLVRDLRTGDPADFEAFARIRRPALPFMIFTPSPRCQKILVAELTRHFRNAGGVPQAPQAVGACVPGRGPPDQR